MRRRGKVIIGIFIAIAILGIGFVVWAETPLGPMREALDAMNSDLEVTFTDGGWLTFQPQSSIKSVGYIIYPGGRVDYRSYAPLAHAIAKQGYLVVIVRMPLNLAVLGANSAQAIIDKHPEIDSWAVGGHSLGGSMAAQYVSNAPSSVMGLVLWAAYPASGNDLSKKDIAAVTIHGTRDGLVSSVQIDDSIQMLPNGTMRVEVEGGNHAQFGWYGPQPGDNEASITREEQQDEVVQATIMLLEKIK